MRWVTLTSTNCSVSLSVTTIRGREDICSEASQSSLNRWTSKGFKGALRRRSGEERGQYWVNSGNRTAEHALANYCSILKGCSPESLSTHTACTEKNEHLPAAQCKVFILDQPLLQKIWLFNLKLLIVTCCELFIKQCCCWMRKFPASLFSVTSLLCFQILCATQKCRFQSGSALFSVL